MDVLLYISSALAIALFVVSVMGMWRIFEKAGRQGWISLIPVYNLLILHELSGKPRWWIALYLVPLINILIAVWVLNALSESFGQKKSFTVGLFFLPLVFIPIMGFGDMQYQRRML